MTNHVMYEQNAIEEINNSIELAKNTGLINSAGTISDGYHTFNELYHHRAMLFASICAMLDPVIVWKSKKHHDGTMYDGMFIVGMTDPFTGEQASYHYDINPYWDVFKVRELDKAPEWDNHTPDQAIERIYKYCTRK